MHPYQPRPINPYQVKTREAGPPLPIDVTLPQLLQQQGPVTGPLTADEAARLALYTQANVTIAGREIEQQKGVTQVARAPYFPQINTSVTYLDNLINNRTTGNGPVIVTTNGGTTTGGTGGGNTTGANTTTGTTTTGTTADTTNGGIIGSGGVGVSNPITVSASLRQLLYDFQRTRFQVAQSKQLEEAAAANYTQTQYDTIYGVKNSYYSWVQSARLLEVYRTNMDAQRAHLADAVNRYKQGIALPSDVTQAQTNVSAAVLNVTSADVNATVARTSLANQIGIDPRLPLQPADSHERTPVVEDAAGLYDLALSRRPELAFAEAAIQANVFGIEAARRGNAPSVNAQIQYVAFGDRFYPNQDTLNFLLTLNWNPFDGGLTAGRVKQAEESLKISRAQLESYRNRVMMEVSQTYAQMRGAEQQVQTTELQVASAEATVTITVNRYRAGLGTFFEVIDAQTASLQAAINRVNAQLLLEQTRAALNHALGVPLVELRPQPASK